MTESSKEKRAVVAVTGATGYIGAILCRSLVESGVDVLGLSRRLTNDPGVTHRPYDLRHPVPTATLAGADAVIHVATETSRGAEPDISVELRGLEDLLKAAECVGSRFVFVSSQTARLDAPTAYGRLKAQAEERVLARGGLVARPGQVYGGPEKGLWGSLARLAGQANFIPRFLPEPVVQPVHVEDLATALARLALDNSLESRVYAIADPNPIGFSDFLRDVAQVRFGRSPLRIPVPLPVVFIAGSAALAFGRRIDVVQRLTSLSDMPRLDSAADLDRLELSLRRFPAGTAHLGSSRKRLIREGRLLTRYFLSERADPWMARRYASALAEMGDTNPLVAGGGRPLCGLLLRLFDQPGARRRAGADDALNRRIDLAMLISESTHSHVRSFMLDDGLASRLRQIGSVGLTALSDAVCRSTDLAIGKVWLDRLRPRAAEHATR